MNVLWIMADQLRWDYLSCYGAKHIDTPNLDWLASKGVRFNRAYGQSPVCGPSRMSFYTGRYVRSHGATWNGFPLRVGEPTLGDHLREIDIESYLVGKTHMIPDRDGMQRLGIEHDSTIGALVAQCGFHEIVRDDGTNHSDYPGRHAKDYDQYLRDLGFGGDNLWEEWANSAEGENGELLTGWLLENSRLTARVPAKHSETAWLTTRGIEFIDSQIASRNDKPWLCHLSYIKPHWPYLAPAPYNDMYNVSDLPPVVRSNAERQTDHPVMKAWVDMRVSQSFSRDEVRNIVGPTYMGLIKQLDDELGRLFQHLEKNGQLDNTMIVFCSDHGENLGDHWLGEKDLFYNCSARVPLIVYDPRAEADATRGSVNEQLVEGIDLAPTFMDFFGAPQKPHIVEGRSLQPLLHGDDPQWRTYAVSEYDYSTRDARRALGIDQKDARLTMIFDGRWKYVHAETFDPLLFDLKNDPEELVNLAPYPEHQTQVERLKALHFDWARQHHTRITRSAEIVEAMSDAREPPGIIIGYKDREELEIDGLTMPVHAKK